MTLLLFATGCPPQQPEPVPHNSLTFNHDVPGRVVTEVALAVSEDGTGSIPVGPNLLTAPMLPGNSLTIEDLVDGYYVMCVTSAPLALGSIETSYYDFGLISGGIDRSVDYSDFPPPPSPR